MRISGYFLRRQVAGCLVLLLAVPLGEAATARPQQSPSGQQTEGASPGQAQPQSSANAAGTPAGTTPQHAAVPDNPNSPQSSNTTNNPQSGSTPSTPQEQQNGSPKAVGTAAAPYEKTMGIPASRPAGAVIAPAKQKRRRSFLIRVGLILGAAAAVGIVVGLSNASPSRPN